MNLTQFFEDLDEEDAGDISTFPPTREPALVSMQQVGFEVLAAMKKALETGEINENASGVHSIVIDFMVPGVLEETDIASKFEIELQRSRGGDIAGRLRFVSKYPRDNYLD